MATPGEIVARGRANQRSNRLSNQANRFFRSRSAGEEVNIPESQPDVADSFQAIQPGQTGERLDALTQDLAGQLRSRADAAAGQNIASTSRRLGGDTSSPAFSLLAQSATTGAAGQAGGEIANLRLGAAETAEQMDLQRQLANQDARQRAQQLANQFAMQRAGLQLDQSRLGLQQQELQQNDELARLRLASTLNYREVEPGRLGAELGLS